MNTFPNLHLVCSFHNTDLLITFGIDFEWLCFEWRFFFKPNWFFRNILGLLKRLNILLLIDKSYIYFLNKAFFMAELSAFFFWKGRGVNHKIHAIFSLYCWNKRSFRNLSAKLVLILRSIANFFFLCSLFFKCWNLKFIPPLINKI